MSARADITAPSRARENAGVFLDIALAYDPATRTCDMVFTGRDFLLDDTPATAMLVSLGVDRRADPDDELPVAVVDEDRPPTFNARRGCVGDALHGRRGCKWWLLSREKQTERTRQRTVIYAEQALGWMEDARGVVPSVTADWMARNMLRVLCYVGTAVVDVSLAVG